MTREPVVTYKGKQYVGRGGKERLLRIYNRQTTWVQSRHYINSQITEVGDEAWGRLLLKTMTGEAIVGLCPIFEIEEINSEMAR